MPKITVSTGVSDARVDVQEPIPVLEDAEPQSRPGEDVEVVDNDYSGWTGAQLTEELEKRGLPKSGTKAEQQKRLEEDDAEQKENLVEDEEEDPLAFLNDDKK